MERRIEKAWEGRERKKWIMWRMCHDLNWINLNGKGREERKREMEIDREIEGEI
jgi:hypothetical protein